MGWAPKVHSSTWDKEFVFQSRLLLASFDKGLFEYRCRDEPFHQIVQVYFAAPIFWKKLEMLYDWKMLVDMHLWLKAAKRICWLHIPFFLSQISVYNLLQRSLNSCIYPSNIKINLYFNNWLIQHQNICPKRKCNSTT